MGSMTRAPDHASLDREQAQKRARKPGLASVEHLRVAHDRLARDVLAYEAELVRVERERDEWRDRVVELHATVDELRAETDDDLVSLADSDRVARLEAQLAEARKARPC